jgi:hypothetical protein
MSDFLPNPPLPDLRMGDVLLYSPSDLVGYLISLKTWTLLSHAEVYIGGGRCIGARIEGVAFYTERVDKYLRFIRRPFMPEGKQFDAVAAYKAVSDTIGKPYDVSAFWAFFNPWEKHRKVGRICSVVTTAYLEGGGCQVFNPEVSPDDISPAQLWQTPSLSTIWERKS